MKRVVFEPTGPYHRAFERALDDAGLPIAKVNPRQARRFAEAAGKLVKTDRADQPCSRAWAKFSICRRAPASARPCRAEGAASGPRRAAQRPHRRQKPRQGDHASFARKANKKRLAEIDVKIGEVDAAIEKLGSSMPR